ncbi:MAG: PIN domain-containing protein [Ilumatobacteraceae bacterium]
MTVFLDTSALVGLVIDGPARPIVLEVLDGDPEWCASALALPEALALAARLGDDDIVIEDLEDAIRLFWDRLAVVPVDQSCLDRAADISRSQPVRMSDAIHLSAAHRLPRPLRFVTFDPGQIPVALSLGYDVVST